MKYLIFPLAIVSLMSASAVAANSSHVKKMGNGWIGLAKQSDPFDTSKEEIFQIIKGDFTFSCGELNMKVDSHGFDGLSFDAQLKYMADDQDPVDKIGKYSTYLGGSDLVTDSRYYSFNLSAAEVEVLKSVKSIKVAGKYYSMGWETKNLSMAGFSSAYSQMCK
jgi:hypothetical protein